MKHAYQLILRDAQKNLAIRNELEKNGDTFQVREIYNQAQSKKKTSELVDYGWPINSDEEVIGADYNGNFYTIQYDGSVYFRDHETDARTLLASTINAFVDDLKKPVVESIELRDDQVISVWIKPGFKPEFD
jgi:hypothetical protein